MTAHFLLFRPARWHTVASCLFCAAISVMTLVLTACMDPVVATIRSATQIENAPGATIVPASGSLVAPNQEVLIRFSESMDRSSLSLRGTVLEYADTPRWESIIHRDDAVSLQPDSDWPLYEALTLEVTGRSIRGYDSQRTASEFTAIDEEIYVSSTASVEDEAMPLGSPGDPFPTIQGAIDRASARRTDGYREIQKIRVSSGTYEESVRLIPRIELYGGYNDAFDTRTPGSSVLLGASGSAATVFIDPEGETVTASLLDGFEVQQPPGDEAVATLRIPAGRLRIVDSLIRGEAVPALAAEGGLGIDIERSTIIGPTSGAVRTAIVVDAADVRMEESHASIPFTPHSASEDVATVVIKNYGSMELNRSRLLAAQGNVGRSIALRVQSDGSARVHHSLIDGGSGFTTQAVLQEGGLLFLRNSTIRAGNATSTAERASVGVRSGGSIVPVNLPYLAVQNCVFFGNGELNSVAGHFFDLSKTWENNLFHDFADVGYVESEFSGYWLTVAEMNGSVQYTGGANNVEADPVLASPLPLSDGGADWSLSPSSPGTVTAGGQDLSELGVEAVDYAGNPRGDDWAIGAYEP